ncbi:unnamed protein product [Phytophthora fragariaefolia]|uniref:Unnamed protein product n=1 Tax=Phytophthora fragariaefolia TaxID=1490495 RepID=A0A9W6XYX2_9STRA|nr:unnamed protein product [Phytophthora fragariaefolia]
MWDFSSRNTLSAPAQAAGLADLVGALSCFHKFAKIFYNEDTQKFIGVARDFVISYANTASDDSGTARLLPHWINTKFSKFRDRLVTKSLRSALRIKKEFKRNDEELVALKELLLPWKTVASTAGSQRSSTGETSSRLAKQADQRHSTKSKIPASVISSLPKSPDGRRLCMRYVSKADCNISDCALGRFKPLTDEAKGVITQRWRGLADEFKDL